jgi:hypothetical protein
MHAFVLGGTVRVLEQWGVPPPSKPKKKKRERKVTGDSKVSRLSRDKPTEPVATKLVIDPCMKGSRHKLQNEFGFFGFITDATHNT